MFHLITHAFFKALLFLGAGSVIHAMSDEQDMRKMGGIWRMIPITYVTDVDRQPGAGRHPVLRWLLLQGHDPRSRLRGATPASAPMPSGSASLAALMTAFYFLAPDHS